MSATTAMANVPSNGSVRRIDGHAAPHVLVRLHVPVIVFVLATGVTPSVPSRASRRPSADVPVPSLWSRTRTET